MADKLKEAVKIRGTAILMRHGETPWNREGRVMGRQPVELDAAGREQVASSIPLARMLKPDLILSSPLARARQSAEIIAAAVGGIEVIDEPQLEEVRYGKWEGMTYQQLIEDESFLAFRKSPIESVTPGGETIVQVQARGVGAVMRAMEANHGRRVLFVSHGDIIRTAVCHFMKLELRHYHRLRVDNASFFGIEIVGDFAEIKFSNLLPDPSRAFLPPFKK
ncbi:MAG: histidine phosphatase family protein [Candidatus Binataceae bacterium]